jgi:hypothetical protein
MRRLGILLATCTFLCAQIQTGPPLPYRVVEGWPQLPAGWNFGEVAAVDVDTNDNVWVFSDGPQATRLRSPLRSLWRFVEGSGQTACATGTPHGCPSGGVHCYNRSPPAATFCYFAVWASESLLRLPASLLTIAFTGQRLLDAEFLARLQVKGVPFDFPDDVLLHNLSLEAAERVLHRLAFLEPYVSQTAPPTLIMIPICRSCADSSGIIRPLPASEPSRPEPAFPSAPYRA